MEQSIEATPPTSIRRSIPPAILLILILVVALALRLHGFDWDHGSDVHPDERFVGDTLVHNLTFPHSPLDLFNPDSGWNPAVASQDPGGALINGHVPHDPGGFNYGSLPLYLIFIFAHLLSWLGGIFPWWSSWQGAPNAPIHAGRVLSAIFDTVSVYLVYLIGTRLAGKMTGLYAAALATFAVLSIQLAHFTTVDSFLTTFATATVLASMELFTHGRPRDYAIVGVLLAAALATKASAVPLVAVVVVAHLWRRVRLHDLLSWRTLTDALPIVAAGLPALFLFQPYMFVDWPNFKTGVQGQSDLASGNTLVFYTIKWHGTSPIIYPLQQLTLYSLGLPLALLAYAGVLYEGIRTLTSRRNAGALVAFFAVAYFISAGLLYMKYLRYMEPIVPVLCVLAALLISAMVRNRVWLISRYVRVLGYAIGAVVLVLTACYGLAYQHIYSTPLTRIQATCWLYSHVPSGTVIAQDTLDEGLPVGTCTHTPPIVPSYVPAGDMPGYGSPDTSLTPQMIAGVLAKAQYYLIGSRRAMDTMAADPQQYPYYHRFYQLLLGSKPGVQDPLGYTLVKSFVVHPQFGPWTFTEQGANQNFDEYDHPPVYVFKNTGHKDLFSLESALTNGNRLATPSLYATPPKSLMLSARDIATNQHSPSYGQMFPSDSLPMRLPVLAWLVVIELLGLLALPISMRLFGRLRDCGFVIAKTVGILLVSYFAWILASLHIAEYSRGEIALCLVPLAAISLAWGVRPRDAVTILRARLMPVLVTEGVFLVAFFVFVYIRMLYPDMWHLITGGEKTMDFSFLNAIVRSRVMPPYDPWFSGGYINYYYYGHFTVATLLKLAGIAPVIAINLAIPTFFALAISSCVSIAFSLIGRIGYALLAGVFALVAGNLYGAQVLVGDLQAASPIHEQLQPVTSAGSSLFLVGGIVDAVSFAWSFFSGLVRGTLAVLLGSWQVLLGHATLPPYGFDGWPWAGSRAIDNHTIITEFPFWTFLFADPHAHMWDVPFVLCILALALAFVGGGPITRARLPIWLSARTAGRAHAEGGALPMAHEAGEPLLHGGTPLPPGSIVEAADSPPLLPGLPLIVWPIMGALIGAIGPTNPWDLAAMLGAIALAIGARRLWLGHGWLRTIIALAWRMAVLVVLSLGLYLPFYSHFQSFYSHIGWTILRHQTAIGDFLTHFGFFIFILFSYLVVGVLIDTNLGRWLRNRARATLFTMYYWDRRDELPRYFSLVHGAAARSGVPLSFAGFPLPVRIIVLAGGILALFFLLILHLVLALLALMIAMALLLLVDRRRPQDPPLLFLHLLIILGLGMAAAAEIVYVKDFLDGDPINFRTNTVFKIYEEAWIMMAIAAAVALARLLRPFIDTAPRILAGAIAPSGGLVAGDARMHGATRVGVTQRVRRIARGPNGWAWTWLGLCALLFAGALVYPIRMVPARVAERQTWAATQFANIGPTLDGSAFIKYAYPGEYQAIQWINQNIQGSPVVLQSRYGGYRDFAARVTMFTGLPSVVNWGFEDSQQRYKNQDAGDGKIYPDEFVPRETDVDTIYSTPDSQQALYLLHKYSVSFIYVGQFEQHGFPDDSDVGPAHSGYPPSGIAKFALMSAAGQLQLAYNHAGVQIYCVDRCPAYLHPGVR